VKLDPRQPWFVISVAVVAVLAGVGVLVVTQSSTPNSSSQGLSFTVLGNVTVGSYPSSITFDPTNGELYVTNMYSENVSVVNSSSLRIDTTIPTGLEARAGALDPLNGRLFVANDFSSNVSVIATQNNSLAATLGFPEYSFTLQDQFDPSTGELYVLANNNPDLLAIDPGTLSVTQVIPVDPNPGGALSGIDPTSHILYFPARGSLAIEPIQQQTGEPLPEIPTESPFGPTTTFFDASNGFVYAMLGGLLDDPGNQVVIVNPATGGLVGDLTVGSWPNLYAFDSARDLLYVDCEASNNVTVIDTVTDSVVASIPFPVGSDPGGIAVDPATGHLFVSELGRGVLEEVGVS